VGKWVGGGGASVKGRVEPEEGLAEDSLANKMVSLFWQTPRMLQSVQAPPVWLGCDMAACRVVH
jgi:hypothetical protein